MKALVLLAVVSGLCCTRGYTRADRPVRDPTRRYEFPGFSVVGPQGPDWSVVPIGEAEPGRPDSVAIVFARRPERPVTKDPASVHNARIAVSTRRHGDRRIDNLQEFLVSERSRMTALMAAPDSPQRRLLSSNFAIADEMPGCLRYEQKAEANYLEGFPGVPFVADIHGYACVDPKWPTYTVLVTYTEEYRPGVAPFRIDSEVDPSLRSLRVTGERPLFVTPIAIGPGGQGVSVFEGNVWVAWGDHGVARVDPRTNEVVQIDVGRDPVGIAAGPEGVWVANRQDGTVSRIDPSANMVDANLVVGRRPLTVATGAGAVWVVDQASSEVARVDPAAGRVVARIRVDFNPSGIAAAADAVFVTSYAQDTVMRIDPATNEVVAKKSLRGFFNTPLRTIGPATAVLGDGALWVAASLDNAVYRLDPGDLHVVARIPLGTRPSGIAVGGGAVWVTLYDEFLVAKIDPRTNERGGEYIPVGVRPVLAAWGEGALWVTNAFSKNLSRIDL